MSNILLSKPVLPEGWLDVSVGEPHIVRETLFKFFDMKDYTLPNHSFEYPNPVGYKPLIDLLEWKHQAKVVITNGAKQALGAAFYALKKIDRSVIEMRIPYWALIPPLMEIHGATCVATMKNIPHHSDNEFWKHDAYLLLAPNNPDGLMLSDKELIELDGLFRPINKPLIHDAAYYSHSYLSRQYTLPTIGDVQIYSLSKMLGLSNLRVGYAVCRNDQYYGLIKEYVESMTVGVSLPSQMFAYDILNQMRGYPTLVKKFEDTSFSLLQNSKRIISQVSPEVLEVPTDYVNNPGMFGWFKTGSKFDQEKAKVNFIDGALFGSPGKVRMNLAFNEEIMQDIVKRLNSCL